MLRIPHHTNPAYSTRLKPVVSRKNNVVTEGSLLDDNDDSDGDDESILQVVDNEQIVRADPAVRGGLNWEIVDLRREVATLKRELDRTKSELKTAKLVTWTARSHQQKEVRLEKPGGMSLLI
jgi:hypothetical protein